MTYEEFCRSIAEQINNLPEPSIEREGVKITPKLLDLYRSWLNNGWAPLHLRDPDGILTEINWINAMEELENEGTALFLEFIKQATSDRTKLE